MREELDILKIVAENPNISQRKISEQTGISLGQVNFLIKKCTKKGLIKIEGQTAKSIKYNITPIGLAEKAELTALYVKKSYAAVIALTDKIRALMKTYKEEGCDIYVYGSRDEMLEITKLALGSESRGYVTSDKKSLLIDQLTGSERKVAIFYWEEEIIDGLEDYHLINILE